ncbi:Putative flippase GtrA (transmembrane translocase of bactoprenol-linked glucose) [Salinibacillus kushneri]|uniref:Putative flippase GtrA (Transmembrane translocase of bactoprenol-linked glucose) n=1 Tax=Salinibacillus kushneri TaxID=237682 RepID=A0A1I0AK18_9BACI|nr:GtrA family protein [Salinibacillus kushneri]SES94012.1 Putative flippase GtrA (transmembrane translocase of bactoprenol-linked glucose) [Salinibacillus kushneri]
MGNDKKKKGPFQFMQFSVIGIANAAIDIGVLNVLLIFFHTEDQGLLLLYNTIAYTLAIGNSYFWNASITFKRSAEGSHWQRLTFIGQAIVSLGVNNLVFFAGNVLLAFIGVPNWLRYNIAKGLAMFFSFLASFFMIKYFVFKDFGAGKVKE